MGWLIGLGIVVLLAVLPLGVRICYDCDGIAVTVLAGPVRILVFPRPKKEKKKKEKPKPEKKKTAPSEKEPPKKEKAGGSLTDFLPLVKLALELLNDFRRKLRVDNLRLKLVLAGDDPCDLAVNYGRAWAALGNLLPRLERVLVIRKRDLNVECDFTADSTVVTAGLDITITLGRLLALAVVYGLRGLKEFLSISKKRKGGAVK
ncbi:MAG: DUF2953 domain-containing protein [Faecousia sp.]